MEAVDVRGRFVWHQLMTRDVSGAKKFYSQLVGWKTQPWPLDPAYTVCHSDVGPMAGIMRIPADLPAEVPAHWLIYIGVRDVDGIADAAVRAGGSVVKPPDDMQGAGRYAVLKDPQGAVFAIIDPENARPEPEGVPTPGSFAWHELATSDHEAAFSFYSTLFGWDALMRIDMGPVGTYLVFGWNGAQRGGIYIKPPANPGSPTWLPYASVANTDERYSLAVSLGARGTVPPMDVPDGGRVANLLDPGGAAFAIAAMPSAAAQPSRPAKSRPAKSRPARKKARLKPKAKSRPKKKNRVAAPARKRGRVIKKAPRRVAKKKVARRVIRRKTKSVRRKK